MIPVTYTEIYTHLMSMKPLVLISLIAVTGCAVDNSDVVQKDYTTDQVSATGLVLKAPSTGMYVSFEQVVKVYADTEVCMNLYAIPPTVQFADKVNGVLEINVWGSYLVTGKLVTINNDMTYPFKRDIDTDRQVLKHEFVHHILHENGYGAASNSHTNSESMPNYFVKCAGGVGINTHN